MPPARPLLARPLMSALLYGGHNTTTIHITYRRMISTCARRVDRRPAAHGIEIGVRFRIDQEHMTGRAGARGRAPPRTLRARRHFMVLTRFHGPRAPRRASTPCAQCHATIITPAGKAAAGSSSGSNAAYALPPLYRRHHAISLLQRKHDDCISRDASCEAGQFHAFPLLSLDFARPLSSSRGLGGMMAAAPQPLLITLSSPPLAL